MASDARSIPAIRPVARCSGGGRARSRAREPVPVPRHGRLLMIWTGQAPIVRALGLQGEEVAVNVVPGPRGIAAVPVYREGPTPFDPGAGVPGPAPLQAAP